ncbi:50S ribosomal protein L1 [Candidatus Dependentiae bacterium]|nr:50S ribosomal protein L1 [Candidatus Dependentiae bacterium]
MSKPGKKHRQAKESAEKQTPASIKEALELVVQSAHAKFDESVDVDITLGIDPTKGEQNVRGAVLLPHGTGKKVRVVAFVRGDHEEEAKKAGADFAGAENLVEKIQGGWMDFDAAVATPDMMALVGKVARVLGPRGLLPNKKVGTVTFQVGSIIEELKKGRVSYRNDKGGSLHVPFGKVSFGADKLLENLEALIGAVRTSKPPTSKGKFIRRVSVSSSMGIGVLLNADELV